MSQRINSDKIILMIMILNIAVLIRNIGLNKNPFIVAIEGHRKKYLVRIEFDIFFVNLLIVC